MSPSISSPPQYILSILKVDGLLDGAADGLLDDLREHLADGLADL